MILVRKREFAQQLGARIEILLSHCLPTADDIQSKTQVKKLAVPCELKDT
jgi:hypothetical protein